MREQARKEQKGLKGGGGWRVPKERKKALGAGYLREVIWDPSRRREKKVEGVVGDYYCITEVKVTHSCEGDAYGCLTR
ncbi:hypothetical protein AYX14_00804 [Cryptococcus neoformans]|nr:hypothetical protein AYX15_00546 [Cryptococcus neoformans var. grubii]OWZ73660.1 hypothetical protein AYX14_00804 [Cryptococcus neoformans var. grubii]